MPKKSFQKKKKFQAMCREQVKQGFINAPGGNWIRYSDSGQGGRMHVMMRDGYKLNK